MTTERAMRLAEQWSNGHVCSVRDGEAEEYHKMFWDMLCAQQKAKKNKPLTLDELQELHGKSVWCKEHNVYGIIDSGGITISFKYDIAYPGLTLYREKPEEGEQWEP